MAIFKKGSDPDALDRSAAVLTASARECTAMRNTVSGVLGSLRGNWSGDNLQSLISQWPAIEAQIDGFGTHLTTLSARLTQNAAAQRGTSGEGGSTNAQLTDAPLPLGGGGPSGTPGGAPGGGEPQAAGFWDDYLESSGLAPDDDAGPLAWPGLIGANALLGLGATSDYMRKVGIGDWRPRGANGAYITRPTGTWARAWSMRSDSTWVAKSNQAGNFAKWGTAAKWATRAGTVLSFGTAAFSQWNQDSGDPSMGTTEKAARAGTMGLTTAAGSWGGAWAGAQGGALIGAAVGGPVGAVVGGLIGGFVGGGLGGMVGDFVGQQIVGPVGDFAEWAGGGIADAAGAVGDFAGDVGDALTFWD
ncbi:hypothetical protein [Humibacillus sp. DSM 29435]|uniref:hypothetical protein n=1 Tax=Humibacillus sp. DSM 29435 TaxID=1869167 RepID=UPI00111308FE|nr:hypothetical protein [Humibacillus sp. DSM 29435]